MTVRDLLNSIGRRWYALALILVAAVFLAVFLYRDGGSFTTNTTVTFQLQGRSALQPDSGATDASVVAFAGTVATEINLGKPVVAYSSAEAPYYGAGVREGVIVSLHNVGNQWTASHPTATIDVQIVGRTSQWVLSRQQRVLNDVLAITAAQQNAAQAQHADRIEAVVDPLSVQIREIRPTRTAQALAFAAIAGAATLVGAWVCVLWDTGMVRRRARGRAGTSHRAVSVEESYS